MRSSDLGTLRVSPSTLRHPGSRVVLLLLFSLSFADFAAGLAAANDKLVRTASADARVAAGAPSETDAVAARPDGQSVLIHTAKRGESVVGLARHYLAKTSFMTVPELQQAIEQANGGRALKPGQRIVIPGFLAQPMVEKARLVPRDFEVRAIYLTAYTAASEKGIKLIRRWHDAGGNAVVFDLKDFDGWVSVPFENPLKPDRGYVLIHNLPKFVRYLHSLHLHAIGRIACFRDAALAASHPELAPRSRRTGGPWHEGKGPDWVDPSIPQVQDYVLALARQGVDAGLDEIQLDYVRFPAQGDQKEAQFRFQTEHPDWPRSNVITQFVTRAYDRIHPTGVLVSLDVFGVMAWQRQADLKLTGQDIAALARHADVLSPMIYPSHFFHFDGYRDPGDAPEHFIREAMQRFEAVTAGSHVVIRPWLQAFAWRTRTYSAGYILTQVSVARENGGLGFLFWNARNQYAKPFAAMATMRSQPQLYFGVSEARAVATHEATKSEPASVSGPSRAAQP